MKRITLLASLLVLLVALAACSGGNAGTALTGKDQEQALSYIEPITDNLLQGLVENNYEAFSRDFDQKMLDAMKPAQFDSLEKQLGDSIGAYQSRKIDTVTDYGRVITANYQGVFTKKTGVQILVTVTKTEPHQVAGLYFR